MCAHWYVPWVCTQQHSESFNVELAFGACRAMGPEREGGEGEQAAETENDSVGMEFKPVPVFAK